MYIHFFLIELRAFPIEQESADGSPPYLHSPPGVPPIFPKIKITQPLFYKTTQKTKKIRYLGASTHFLNQNDQCKSTVHLYIERGTQATLIIGNLGKYWIAISSFDYFSFSKWRKNVQKEAYVAVFPLVFSTCG